jgi:hypothetical protein
VRRLERLEGLGGLMDFGLQDYRINGLQDYGITGL